MEHDALAPWLAGFTAPLGYAGSPAFSGTKPLPDVLRAAVAELLPPGEDPAAHVAVGAVAEPGRLAVVLRGITPAGRRAVDGLAGD